MRTTHRVISPVLLGLVVTLLCCGAGGPARTGAQDREPVGPGSFYPRSAPMLKAAIQAMLGDAVPARAERPLAIVVPHAGYVFSGQIAADAYHQASAYRYDTIVIVGTNHTTAGFRGVGICPGATYRTPLGAVPIDETFVAALQKADADCVFDATVHTKEHSVEVQVPFIQQLFPTAKIVPLVVGQPDPALCARLGRALASLAKDRSVLLVASSDLSHYPSSGDAGTVDRNTLMRVALLDADAIYRMEVGDADRGVPALVTHACGAAAIMAVITAAKALGATRTTMLSYANSGDTIAGDPSRVVGYGAVAFAAGEPEKDVRWAMLREAASVRPDDGPLQRGDKQWMVALARETIRRFLTTETLPLPRGFSARLERKRGVFVTLKKRGDLRGCIGHIAADGRLPRLVGAMAFASAFQDPRFEKVRLDEVSELEIEISVLTPPTSVGGPDDIVVGRDGVIISADGRSAVFLPQVATEQGWNRDQMLDNLCEKAGLPDSRWRRPNVKFETFQADVFSERDVK